MPSTAFQFDAENKLYFAQKQDSFNMCIWKYAFGSTVEGVLPSWSEYALLENAGVEFSGMTFDESSKLFVACTRDNFASTESFQDHRGVVIHYQATGHWWFVGPQFPNQGYGDELEPYWGYDAAKMEEAGFGAMVQEVSLKLDRAGNPYVAYLAGNSRMDAYLDPPFTIHVQSWGGAWTITTTATSAATSLTAIATENDAAGTSAAEDGGEGGAPTGILIIAIVVPIAVVFILVGLAVAWRYKFQSGSALASERYDAGDPTKVGVSLDESNNAEDDPEQPLVIEKPVWWDTWPERGGCVREVASPSVREAVQKLLDGTWSDVVTRDRIRAGGERETYHLEVVNVLHNKNRALWENYVRARHRICKSHVRPLDKDVATSEDPQASTFGPLEADVNEFLLFHGTKPSSADKICAGDFKINLAGSRAGTLYGNGVYFAEKSSKSDEYAADDEDGVYQGLFAMLLCRVTCGNMLYSDSVRPDGGALQEQCIRPGAAYHSVLGDREKARGTYREFIVYDNDQAYPEYVVIYRRGNV